MNFMWRFITIEFEILTELLVLKLVEAIMARGVESDFGAFFSSGSKNWWFGNGVFSNGSKNGILEVSVMVV